MASTITLSGDYLTSLGNRQQTQGTGNIGTYATGGIAVSAKQLGLGLTESMAIYPAGGYVFSYNPTAATVMAYEAGSANSEFHEVDTNTNLSAVTFVWVAIGR